MRAVVVLHTAQTRTANRQRGLPRSIALEEGRFCLRGLGAESFRMDEPAPPTFEAAMKALVELFSEPRIRRRST